MSVNIEKLYKIDIKFKSLIDNNLHTETMIKVAVSQINYLEDRRLVKSDMEDVKVNMGLAMIPKYTILFTIWAPSRP